MFRKGLLGIVLAAATMLAPTIVQAREHHRYYSYRTGYYGRHGHWHPYEYGYYDRHGRWHHRH